jgi:HAD superfamily hydrolase (TIGR01484 family)
VTQYKLIAVDVDGTLLTSKGTISPRTREALLTATQKGIEVAVATGRRRSTARPILDQLDVPHFLVASQGAAVWRNGEILFHSHLPAESARAALDLIRRHGLATVILGNALREDVIWIDGDWHDNERIASYINRNRHVVREFDPEALEFDPIQFIVMDAQEKLEALDEELTGHTAPPPSEDAPAQSGPDTRRALWRVIFSRNQFTAGPAIEIVGPQTSKAAALGVLCERLRITHHQVIAFGDNINDVEMLDFAGTGVAMGNATADARAAASRIAPSNDEDGIAVVLEELGVV